MKTIIAIIISSVTVIGANAQTVNVNSLDKGYDDVQAFVAWKKYVAEREKTRKGEPLIPLDAKPSNPELKRSEDEEAEPRKHEFTYRVTAPPPMDAKARYDAFLRSKGFDPDMIGAATVVNGRMFVPTIEEQYATRKSSYATLNRTLAGAPNFPRRWWPAVRDLDDASIRADVSAHPKNASHWRNAALYSNCGELGSACKNGMLRATSGR
jgi:hypothetical protein